MADEGVNDDAPSLGAATAALKHRLVVLRLEHQALDTAVAALQAKPMPDQIMIARLKKRKLLLKDQLFQLEDQLTPDIIA